MENEQHPDTFQPTENRYSGLGGEEFQPEKPDLRVSACLYYLINSPDDKEKKEETGKELSRLEALLIISNYYDKTC